MSPSRRKERLAAGLAGPTDRVGSVALMLVVVLLAALVVLGMATGTHRQFDKGVAPLSVVILIQVVGVVSLLCLGGVARACLGVGQGRHRILKWTLLAIPIWLFWAFLRILEYSS